MVELDAVLRPEARGDRLRRAFRLRRGLGGRAPHRRLREHPRARHLHRQGVRAHQPHRTRDGHHQPAVPRPVHGRGAHGVPRPPHARPPHLRLRRRRSGQRQAVLPGGRRGVAAHARGARHHRAAVLDDRLRRLHRQVLGARPQAHPGPALPGAPPVLDRGDVGDAQLRAVRRARVRRTQHLLHAGADRGQPGHARPHRAGQRDREGGGGGGARSGRGAGRLADLSRGVRRRLEERGDGGDPGEPAAIVRLPVQDRTRSADEARRVDDRCRSDVRLDGRERAVDHRLARGRHHAGARARRGRRRVRVVAVQLAGVGDDRPVEPLARAVRPVRVTALPRPRRPAVPPRSSPPTHWESDMPRQGLSLWSRNSFCSIASTGSSFSIGSIGSFASIGSVGSACSAFPWGRGRRSRRCCRACRPCRCSRTSRGVAS